MKSIFFLIPFFLLMACTPAEPLPMSNATMPSISPTRSESAAEKEPAFVSFSELVITDSYPLQAGLHVSGDLPTPCNQFEAEVLQPDADKNIQVTVYSVVTTQAMCAQVLQPFDETLPIDILRKFDGIYTVYLNGEAVGQIIVQGNRISAVSQ